MKLSFLCTDEEHPVNQALLRWADGAGAEHQVEIVRRKRDLTGGDILFLVSCSEIVTAADRAAYRASLVLHASDLPRGRGWSPLVWEIANGSSHITLSLIEAEDKVDSGRIWKKLRIDVPRHALWEEINALLFSAELELIGFAVRELESVRPTEQDPGVAPTYYPKRNPGDSRIDPTQSIESQFDKIRVCDPKRYPAFFEMRGHKYRLVLEKFDE